MLHVGQTEYEAGIGGGVKMHNMGVTKAACINQEVGNVALDVRCEGFKKGLGEGTTVDIVPTTIDPTEVKGAVTAYLSSHPDTQAIFILGSDPAMPALDAIESSGLAGKVKAATFDLSEGILQAVRRRQDGVRDRPAAVHAGLPAGRAAAALQEVRADARCRRADRPRLRHQGECVQGDPVVEGRLSLS